MKCIVLGSGGSLGTPEIGCNCYTCTSDNPKNKRLRTAVYFESPNAKVFIDASTDLRQQALNNNLSKMDALVFTHAHADHISGVDDLKPIVRNSTTTPIKAYMNEQAWGFIKGTYSYLFEDSGSQFYRPLLEKVIIDNEQQIVVNDMVIQTFPQIHGDITSLGMRVGNLAYSTDFAELPESSYKYLEDLDVWLVDCMRFHWSPTHSTYERTMDLISRVKPKRVVLIHMSHEIEYESIKKMLPSNIIPAYDGMVVEF